MAYDFLTMSKQVANTAGVSGNIGGVTGQTGDIGRIIRFVREACMSVESIWGDWKFLYGGQVPIELQQGIATYSVPSEYPLHRWNKDCLYIDGQRIARKAVFEYHERPLGKGDFSEGYPLQVVIMPDNSLRFIGVPDQAYDFRGDFYKAARILVNNTDVPQIPQQYCPIIEAEALRRYANYDNAVELKTEAQESYAMWLTLLENDQKPGGTSSDTSYGVDLITTTY